jgi:short-subunit dehydrogenase
MMAGDRVAVVTGASSGIGWALSRELSARGWKVGLIARRRDKLDQLETEIVQAGGTAAGSPADVADRDGIAAAVRDIENRLGRVDLLVANAGVGYPTLAEPVNLHHIEEMCRVNYLGVVYSIAAVLPQMLRRRSGHLAAISSLAAYKGLPGESGYCASKAAVNAYMEGLRIQLRDRGIRVTTICPGFVRTPMTAANEFHMPWVLEADQAARRIVRALDRRRKVYNFPWQLSLVMKLTAWLPDWVLARSMQKYNENPPFPDR